MLIGVDISERKIEYRYEQRKSNMSTTYQFTQRYGRLVKEIKHFSDRLSLTPYPTTSFEKRARTLTIRALRRRVRDLDDLLTSPKLRNKGA